MRKGRKKVLQSASLLFEKGVKKRGKGKNRSLRRKIRRKSALGGPHPYPK